MQPILGLPNCSELQLIRRVDAVITSNNEYQHLIQQFTTLFAGIGCIKNPYHIKQDAVPVVTPVRETPLPLTKQLKETIDDLANKIIK